jgi:nucleotide-binding universal stress UspA family protein
MNSPRWSAAHHPHLPRFERILCAVDVVQPTPGALGFAGLIAERFGASLEALYVGSSADGLETEENLRQVAQLASGVASVTTSLAVGRPAQTILARAVSRDADLIVLGSRQRSDLGWQFRDDVVRDVSALASCATLTVHERDAAAVIERILVPVDFGPATSCMLAWASTFALLFGAKLQLLHVVSRERHSVRNADRVELAAIEQRLAARGIAVGSQITVAGSAAIGIEGYNLQEEFDLVVMGLADAPHGPTRLTRGIISTLRNRMPVPLLSVRATGFDATRPRRAELGQLEQGARA